MDILVYLEGLMFLECLAFCVAIVLDYYGKKKDFSLIRLSGFKKFIFFKSKFEGKRDFVSKNSFWFQILNYVYLFAYLIVAILESLVFHNPILSIILVVLNLISFGLLVLLLVVFGLLL